MFIKVAQPIHNDAKLKLRPEQNEMFCLFGRRWAINKNRKKVEEKKQSWHQFLPFAELLLEGFLGSSFVYISTRYP